MNTKKRRNEPKKTPEAAAIDSAMTRLDLGNVYVANMLGLQPSFVSQLRTGRRPVPSEYAIQLAALLHLDPEHISPGYRQAKQVYGNEAFKEIAYNNAKDQAILKLQNTVKQLSLAVSFLYSAMTSHRPTEAREVFDAVRKYVPESQLCEGELMHELNLILSHAGKTEIDLSNHLIR